MVEWLVGWMGSDCGGGGGGGGCGGGGGGGGVVVVVVVVVNVETSSESNTQHIKDGTQESKVAGTSPPHISK